MRSRVSNVRHPWRCRWFPCLKFGNLYCTLSRSQCPRGLRRRSAAAHLLRLWVRIPPGAWMFVCCECCVLSGRGFCDGLITRPEESYQLWCVVVCDLEKNLKNEEAIARDSSASAIKKVLHIKLNYFFLYPFIPHCWNMQRNTLSHSLTRGQ